MTKEDTDHIVNHDEMLLPAEILKHTSRLMHEYKVTLQMAPEFVIALRDTYFEDSEVSVRSFYDRNVVFLRGNWVYGVVYNNFPKNRKLIMTRTPPIGDDSTSWEDVVKLEIMTAHGHQADSATVQYRRVYYDVGIAPTIYTNTQAAVEKTEEVFGNVRSKMLTLLITPLSSTSKCGSRRNEIGKYPDDVDALHAQFGCEQHRPSGGFNLLIERGTQATDLALASAIAAVSACSARRRGSSQFGK